jgi:hypothetical protein
MRDAATGRPGPRLKSPGPEMKAVFPVHARTAYSTRFMTEEWRRS